MKYRMSNDEFYVVTAPAHNDQKYKFEVSDIALIAPYLKINQTLSPYLEPLTDTNPAQYYFDSIVCRQYSLMKGVRSKVFHRVFDGKLPQRMVIGLFTQDAVTGRRDKSPLLTASKTKLHRI